MLLVPLISLVLKNTKIKIILYRGCYISRLKKSFYRKFDDLTHTKMAIGLGQLILLRIIFIIPFFSYFMFNVNNELIFGNI